MLTAILRDCEFLVKSYSRFAIKIILAESPRLRSSQPRKAAPVSAYGSGNPTFAW